MHCVDTQQGWTWPPARPCASRGAPAGSAPGRAAWSPAGPRCSWRPRRPPPAHAFTHSCNHLMHHSKCRGWRPPWPPPAHAAIPHAPLQALEASHGPHTLLLSVVCWPAGCIRGVRRGRVLSLKVPAQAMAGAHPGVEGEWARRQVGPGGPRLLRIPDVAGARRQLRQPRDDPRQRHWVPHSAQSAQPLAVCPQAHLLQLGQQPRRKAAPRIGS